jgi:hypothetical protein
MDEDSLRRFIHQEIDDAKSVGCDSAYMNGVKDGKVGALKYVLNLMDGVV